MMNPSRDLKAVSFEAHEAPTAPRHDSGVDLRASARVPLEVSVSLESDSQFFAGLSRDVSRGGIFVATYRALPVGSHVTLRLELPDGPLDATGLVRWVREQGEGIAPGVGIAFESLGPEALKRIERFCDFRPPLYHEVEHA
jgi:uncharacterized protein (TIGR02266 family)